VVVNKDRKDVGILADAFLTTGVRPFICNCFPNGLLLDHSEDTLLT